MILRGALVALLCAASISPVGSDPTAGERVLLTREQALAEIFPDRGDAFVERFTLTAADRTALAKAAVAVTAADTVEVIRVLGPKRDTLGFALVLDEKGKYQPITFMVGVGRDLAVRGVQVMVYREDRGDEVKHARFLRQYRGKRSSDPIRTHKDIVNVTGATISVQSLNRGVRRALVTLETLLVSSPRPPRSRSVLPGRPPARG
jgi:Na+-translocating ferredoxin:NAD+ oxidoreductase RnfG subunit